MLAKRFIDDSLPTLQPSHSGLRALDRMEACKVRHLPIVSDEYEYLGLVSDNDIYDANNFDLVLGQYESWFMKPHVHMNQHLFEILGVMRRFDLSLIPVLSLDHSFMGSISKSNITNALIDFVSVEDPGGIIVLELCEVNYSLSEISQIVESNDAKILNFSINSKENSKELDVTLKVNRTDLSSLIQAFTRYDYRIIGTYNDNSRINQYYDDRFDEFMKYLDF